MNGFQYTGRMDFVDLAGSESASKSSVTHDRLKEAGFINKSLMHLRKIITFLGSKKKKKGKKLSGKGKKKKKGFFSKVFGSK